MKITHFHDVVDKVKLHLIDYLNDHNIDTNRNFSCINPNHEDKSPSASILDRQHIYCFGCGARYDIFDAVNILENKPKTGKLWIENTLKYLCEKYNIPIELSAFTEDDIYEIDTYRAYECAAGLLCHDIGKSDVMRNEVRKRGWNEDTLEEYDVGWVPDFEAFQNALNNRGFTLKFLKEIDLLRRDLFTPQHLIFTWKDEYGRPVGFTGRDIAFDPNDEECKKRGKKYNNIRATNLKCNIFRKNSRLFGIDTAIDATPPLWIFEGQSDVITAKQHGLINCACFGGGNLSDDQIHLIKKLRIYDLIVCLDSDNGGITQTLNILEKRLPGHRDLNVKIVNLPEGEDPDSFIRSNGITALHDLKKWAAFDWRLSRFNDDEDPVQVCNAIIPLIANDPSPVAREEFCRQLSRYTDYPIATIREEVSILLDAKSFEISKERNSILDKLTWDIKTHPTEAEQILQAAQTDLTALNIKHNKDAFSADEFLVSIQELKHKHENKTGEFEGFRLSPELKAFEKTLMGEWKQDVFLCIGGKPNTGKSTLISKILFDILKHNDNTTCIYHTIDDSREQLFPKFISIADDTNELAIGHITNPNYWKHKVNYDLINRRQVAFNKVSDYVRDGRFVMKDVGHGHSLAYIDNLLSFHRDKNEYLVYVLDNFHKLDWFADIKDTRIRWKKTSAQVKNLAEKHKCCILCSVEYPKVPPGVKPTNENIAESNQISYDANFIAHLYSELADTPELATVYHTGKNTEGEDAQLPRIELLIGKNKINDRKNIFFLDFFPAHCQFKPVTLEKVREDKRLAEHERTSNVAWSNV